MSVQGLCQICESAPAKYACDRCGAMVCADHFDRDLGLCSSCAASIGRRPEGDEPDRDRTERGRHGRGEPGEGDTGGWPPS